MPPCDGMRLWQLMTNHSHRLGGENSWDLTLPIPRRTGSGKTSASYHIYEQAAWKSVSFLVLARQVLVGLPFLPVKEYHFGIGAFTWFCQSRKLWDLS